MPSGKPRTSLQRRARVSVHLATPQISLRTPDLEHSANHPTPEQRAIAFSEGVQVVVEVHSVRPNPNSNPPALVRSVNRIHNRTAGASSAAAAPSVTTVSRSLHLVVRTLFIRYWRSIHVGIATTGTGFGSTPAFGQTQNQTPNAGGGIFGQTGQSSTTNAFGGGAFGEHNIAPFHHCP